MFLIFIKFLMLSSVYGGMIYDTYRAKPIGLDEVKKYEEANNTSWCTVEVEPCDPDELRRVDGTCNNLENPSIGAVHTPFVRVLPPVFSEGFEPRKAKSGDELLLARKVRTSLLAEGRVPSQVFTQLVVNFLVFLSADIIAPHDTEKYLSIKRYCCTPKGLTDRDCAPNKVPDDDPLFRFTDIRCLNMTRPESFQSIGCAPKNTVPERVVMNTPLLDLSAVYSGSSEKLRKHGRLFEGGLLKYEISNGKIWPPSAKTKNNICIVNDNIRETRCHAFSDAANILPGVNLVYIWFWRLHNVFASNLAAVNPCWDDDKLFYTAREINIAVFLQILYYELFPVLLGRDNLIKEGLISPSPGFRDLYNKNIMPQLSVELPYVLRWVHTIQDGVMKMYDKDGYYLKQYPIVNLTKRTGFFDVDDNLAQITQGNIRQGCAHIDHIVDRDIVSIGTGSQQRALDLCTNDIAKSRYFGLDSYIKYRKFCFGNKITSYAHLRGIIDNEKIGILQDTYESVEDIELMGGIWLEKLIKGGSVPATFYCLVVDQLMRNLVSDRHWYERPNRPNAFTIEQLLEIRKYTAARVLCDVGDTITSIQPYAFLRANSDFNQMRDCSSIKNINYEAWRDSSCHEGDPSDNYYKH